MKVLMLLCVTLQAVQLNLTSAVEWEFFTLQLTQDKPYLLVELQRDPSASSRELLTADFDTSPIVYQGNSGLWTITRRFSSVETWAHHDSYHFLLIPCSQASVYSLRSRVGAYFERSLSLHMYHIFATFHDGSKCPNDCSGLGRCERGTCQCDAGWAGGTCSYPVTEVSYGLYYDTNRTLQLNTDGVAAVEMQVSEGGEVFAYLLEEPSGGYLVPSYDYYSQVFNGTQKVTIPVIGSPLYLLISSQELASVCFAPAEAASEPSQLIYILVGVLVPVALLCLILAVVLLFLKARRRGSQLSNAYPIVPLTLREAQLIEQLNLNSPEKVYSQLTSNYSSECAVCLEVFRSDSLVRMLDCGHVYHSPCLESLVNRQQNCCVCKRSFENKLSTSYLTTIGDHSQH